MLVSLAALLSLSLSPRAAAPLRAAGLAPRTAGSPAMQGAAAVGERPCVITCSNCKASYSVEEDALGPGAGKRVRCSNCDHEWFQSVARLARLPEDMELVEYPQEMKDRMAAGKPAEARAAFRAYVGNLPFGVVEEELADLFGEYGNVVHVNVMTDEARGRLVRTFLPTTPARAAAAHARGSSLTRRSVRAATSP